MVDSITGQAVKVITPEGGVPYFIVREQQLEAVTSLLEAHRVRHRVGRHAISIDGEPEVVIVDLGREVDPRMVQEVLDRSA